VRGESSLISDTISKCVERAGLFLTPSASAWREQAYF